MPCRDSSDSGPNYSKEWKECERELCAARWTLLQLVKICNANKIQIPSTLKKHIEREKTAQLKHRKEDGEYIAREINWKIDKIDRDIKEIKSRGGLPGQVQLAENRKLKGEVDEINAISDEDLLEGSWLNPVTPIDDHE